MTVKEAKDILKDVPGHYIICNVAQFTGEYFEISSLEVVEDIVEYYDVDDNPKEGNVILL